MRLTAWFGLCLSWLFAAPLLAGGCDGNGGTPLHGAHGDAHAHHQAASDPVDNLDTGQETPEGTDTYVAGLEKTGEVFTVRLIASLPAPKDTGRYTWTIALLDAADEPVSGATIVAEPTMEAHGHGTFPPTTSATALADAGHYELVEMDLFMPGVWRVTLTIEHGDATDKVMYHFDLEG